MYDLNIELVYLYKMFILGTEVVRHPSTSSGGSEEYVGEQTILTK